MSNEKILFFDIDGTLLSETTNTIPSSALVAIEQAKQNGHYVFINTGRPLSIIDSSIRNLPIDGFVCGCGTYIEYHNKQLLHKQLSHDRCKQIVDDLEEYGAQGVLEGKEYVLFTNSKSFPFTNQVYQNCINHNFPIKSVNSLDYVFDKFCVIFNDSTNIEGFKNTIKDFEYIVRAPDFGEIVPLGYSKATGIEFLLKYFDLSKDDCYVFGDSTNDIPMLRYVKHSVVMGNGDPSLFDLAYFVTKSVDDDGIYYAMKQLKLI